MTHDMVCNDVVCNYISGMRLHSALVLVLYLEAAVYLIN